MAAPSGDDAWAVGLDLVLRWDGKRWRRAAAPVASYWGVSAAARGDVWAVGTTVDGLIVAHWNGARWKRVPFLPVPASTPRVEPGVVTVKFAFLEDVLALGSDDVWVVGSGSNDRPITAHWDGTSWRSYPVDATFTGLGSLAARSPHDVWAAGGDRGGSSIAQWNGRSWRTRGSYFWIPDIVVRSGEVWAILDDVVGRWNGSSWIPLEPRHPNLGLRGLAVDSSGDVWAVGFRFGNGLPQRQAVVRFRCSA